MDETIEPIQSAEPTTGTGTGTTTAAEPTTTPAAEPTTAPAAEPSAEKTFTQADIDAAVTEAQAKWKAEQDQAARLAKLSKEDRAREQLKLDREKFDKEKADFARERLIAETKNQLMNRNLPTIAAERLCGKDAEETKANIDAFEKDYNAAIEAAVTERMKGKPPKITTQNTEADPFLMGFGN